MDQEKGTQIGWIIINKDEEFTNTYETAAWYENVAVKPGKYPLYVYGYDVKKDGEVDCHIGTAYASLQGTITSDYFGTPRSGSPVGKYDSMKNAGKPTNASFSVRMFDLCRKIIDDEHAGNEARYELLPNYEVRQKHYIWENENFWLPKLFVKN